jgi:hypothetical protein
MNEPGKNPQRKRCSINNEDTIPMHLFFIPPEVTRLLNFIFDHSRMI